MLDLKVQDPNAHIDNDPYEIFSTKIDSWFFKMDLAEAILEKLKPNDGYIISFDKDTRSVKVECCMVEEIDLNFHTWCPQEQWLTGLVKALDEVLGVRLCVRFTGIVGGHFCK